MQSPQLLVTATPPSWKRRILLGLERVMYWTGAGFAYVNIRRLRGTTILMYHSVASSEFMHWIEPSVRQTPEVFETQMRFLSQNRCVLSLSQLLEELERGQTPNTGTVVVTFDDGYIDNMTVAAPILARYGIPAIWYLPTGMINRGENPWIDQIYTAFRTRSKAELSIQGIGSWDLRDSRQQFTAYNTLKEKLLVASFTERESILTNLIEELQPTETPPRLVLSWEEIRKVSQEFPGIEIGLHSQNHVDLSKQSQEVVRMELEQCIADFRRELGREPVHFSFPYNQHNAETRAIIREFGLRSAMGEGNETLIVAGADPFALPRVEPPSSSTLFRFYTSGAFPGLPKALLGRAA